MVGRRGPGRAVLPAWPGGDAPSSGQPPGSAAVAAPPRPGERGGRTGRQAAPGAALPRRFWRARQGVAVVEFALMAPVLVVLYLATVELSLAYSAYRKVGAAASLAAELASIEETIDAHMAAQVMAAAGAVLEPVSARGLAMRLSAVVIDASGQGRVSWSVAQGIEQRTGGQLIDVPPMFLPDESVVMAEVWLDYVSPLVITLPGIQAMHHQHFVYPRLNDHVEWEQTS